MINPDDVQSPYEPGPLLPQARGVLVGAYTVLYGTILLIATARRAWLADRERKRAAQEAQQLVRDQRQNGQRLLDL